MLRNFLKTTFRSMARSRMNFAINIAGLAIGLAACMLVILFIKDEVTFDQFHEKADQIYRPYAIEKEDDQTRVNSVTPGPLGPKMLTDIPEIIDYTVVGQFSDLIKKGQEPIQELVYTVSPSFFDIFTFQVVSGSVEGVFTDPRDIVLTTSMAQKYFGDKDPVGQTLEVHVGEEYRGFVVKAVTEDPPSNSSFDYDFLIGEANNKYIYPERMLKSWFAVFMETYFLLEEGADASTVEEKMIPVLAGIFGQNSAQRSYEVKMQPLTAIHLDTTVPAGNAAVSDPRYSYILGSVALVILVIACVNFMNLSIGLSLSRAREISMRKIMGAGKRQLIVQFLGESVLLSFFATVLGVVIMLIFLPTFNEMAGRALQPELSLFNVLALITVMLVVGLGAGSYPAVVLAGFKPLDVLKGQAGIGLGRQHLRNIMMTLQFVFSIFLIASTLVMSRQLSYLSNRNLGFNEENVVIVQAISSGRGIREMITRGMEEAQLFKTELLKSPDIAGIGISTFTAGAGGWLQMGYNDDGINRSFQVNVVEEDYISVNEMEIVMGRDFSKEIASDKREGIIVNEAFLKDFGMQDPIGKRIPGGEFGQHQIIGVVKDFNYLSLHTAVGPIVLTMNAAPLFAGASDIGISSRPSPKMSIRIKPQRLAGTLSFIEDTWEQVYPGAPFEFDFLDERLAAQYEQEKELNKIITTAAVLAIVIGCLGLFALSKLSIESRSKEIGIRKVLGASYQTILYAFSRGYGLMILIALVIAIPITWYLIGQWLTSFEYTIALNGLEFLLAGLLTLVIAVATVSLHSFRVAKTNPALTLRDE
jgi:putative ABC transport system permease protein